MSASPEVVLPVLSTLATLLLGSIPVVTAILKIQGAISENKHSLAILSQKQEAADELIKLAIHQLTQRVDHVAARLKDDGRSLEARLRDCENFLAKNQNFVSREKR